MSDCGAAPVGAIPVTWALPADAQQPPMLVQAPPPHHIIQSQPQATVCIEQPPPQQQQLTHPPQVETPTPQVTQEPLGE